MKIRFETTIDDLVAFNRFHFESSPSWRRQRFSVSMTVPIVIAIPVIILSICFFSLSRSNWQAFAVLMAGLLSLAWLVSAGSFYFTRRRITAGLEDAESVLQAENGNPDALGWRELELVNSRLIVKLELSEADYDLRAIQKIVDGGRYTFIYLSLVQAFIVPMDLYPEEEYREFVSELREAWDNRETPRRTDSEPPVMPSDERIEAGPA